MLYARDRRCGGALVEILDKLLHLISGALGLALYLQSISTSTKSGAKRAQN